MVSDGIGGIRGHYAEPIRVSGDVAPPAQTEPEQHRRIPDDRATPGREEPDAGDRRPSGAPPTYGGAPDPTGQSGSSLDAFA